MSERIRSKTSRKGQPPSEPRRQPEKVRQQLNKELIESDPELIVFTRAIALFNAGRFAAAKEAFGKLTEARNRDLAHSAKLRIRMCEQRLALPEKPTE